MHKKQLMGLFTKTQNEERFFMIHKKLGIIDVSELNLLYMSIF